MKKYVMLYNQNFFTLKQLNNFVNKKSLTNFV